MQTYKAYVCVCVSIWEQEERGKEEENDKPIEPSVNNWWSS